MRRLTVFLLCFISSQIHSMAHQVNGENAIDNAIMRYGLHLEPQLMRMFAKAGISYPPRDIALLAFKQERYLQLWAKNNKTSWTYINTYPLTASSGRLGPKLKEHDRQIPEGIYRLTMFNPFSSMHLSMMINYPNDFDRLQAMKDGRNALGGDIFVHGKSMSVGCLAVGDRAIDQLFLLTRRVGLSHVRVIIAPNDLRQGKAATNTFSQPSWLPELYQNISHALRSFPVKNA